MEIIRNEPMSEEEVSLLEKSSGKKLEVVREVLDRPKRTKDGSVVQEVLYVYVFTPPNLATQKE